MSRRWGRSTRCMRCRMLTDLCICSSLTPHESPLDVFLVTHPKEANRPTNTAHLVKKVLVGSVYSFNRSPPKSME
ncbi:MAG: DTW domain-containing protein [Myxococcales bacterium]|nr:DTW domain-containing protein [Myxococcales bacterium]